MKAIALYEGGINFIMQYAVSVNGDVFERFKERTRYGYSWGRWIKSKKDSVDINNLPCMFEAGFGNARIVSRDPSVRLPNH